MSKHSIVAMRSIRLYEREWFSHTGHRTYELADRLYRMASAGLPTIARIRDENRETEFIATWPTDTLVHRLARMAAHDMFYDEIDTTPSSWELRDETAPRGVRPVRYMSVTVAMRHYGLEHGADSFEVPRTSDVSDACHDYFTSDLMWSETYDQLLHTMAAEVFHTVFPYRTMLYNLNRIAAAVVSELDAEMCSEEPKVASLFAQPGRLARKKFPDWAQPVVCHRDRNHCTYCRCDLTRGGTPLGKGNFDHMVPLAEGGLNDITNIQLLCRDCNSEKSAKLIEPSDQYIKWFP
ncbi:HNH endonuclease [Nocardia sp. NPDC051832]|uniref:HNH endonuclease n=1 Tax=Nocardia sp. NPDC051832 TaxID=3155673 RepID=UPI0034177693